MMDKGQLVDVIRRIMDGRTVVAMYAPAIGAQFRASAGQLEGALKAGGFSDVIEVALGADVTADNEAKEFEDLYDNMQPYDDLIPLELLEEPPEF